ncbi:MAG: NTP transferase domain-containing protein [bacterium]|nr:NTP transferase domain-containing protein [bacterium]
MEISEGWKNITAGVVLAAGYGHLGDPEKSKLVATVGKDVPMVARVVDLLEKDLRLATFVVVSEKFFSSICGALPDFQGRFIVQTARQGTAGALRLVLSEIGKKFRHLVVLYGDMPCWRPESIQSLLDSHLRAEGKPVISMFYISLGDSGHCPCPAAIMNYGRIAWNDNGKIAGIYEPNQPFPPFLQISGVNPSAWVYDVFWVQNILERLEENLTPHDKGDGHSSEFWLPDLVVLAQKQGKTVNIVELTEPIEALGVNTMEDLENVRRVLKE